jgi:hypothetical protein
MKRHNKEFLGLGMLATALTACGGGGDGGNGSNTGGTGTQYAFVPPVVNSSRVYAETVVDNSNNTIAIGYMETVLSVAADGIITEQQQSTSSSATVNGTNYTPLAETQTYNSFGRETEFTYTESNGTPVSCAYSQYAGGPTPPLAAGQTWQIDFTEACNANPAVHFSQTGTVVDVESVTVPAGTFNALKWQVTTVWTDNNGTTHTQTTTNWLDTASFHSVKESITIAYSGTLPVNGYPVSRQIELQSTS